ncbi:hypothetical protein [Actinomadura madurae]|uniref:hypothetical protein n=1 Tax=Actinomadura madurae TaxID=1993 RepID=UPI0020D21830|nr:hypothetical protein [Actinomadura madurae]MCP9952606.1 hypothetical protein [Actinomadura madurae]MCP9969368.1 hypothetical protein [Actinomadura madurae]MCP9981836.1 hypothetical protein [Actinomadura madurae]MCQ0018056.1 hypothetical protein [Actinomadura madurae]
MGEGQERPLEEIKKPNKQEGELAPTQQDGGSPGGPPSLERKGTSFTLKARDDLPEGTKVRLRPQIVLEDGKIARVLFGRQRTPSPFGGGRMGDHTVAWQALVDSVHALVHGLTLEEAIAEVEKRQKEVQAWMEPSASRDVIGRRVFRLLDDPSARKPLLEDTAGRVRTLIDDAKKAWDKRQGTTTPSDEMTHAQPVADETDLEDFADFKYFENPESLSKEAESKAEKEISDKLGTVLDEAGEKAPTLTAEELLARAIAHHLAYLNYLPFATVPAESARGSKGASEGRLRSHIIDIERYGEPGDDLTSREFELDSPQDEIIQDSKEESEESSAVSSSAQGLSASSETSTREAVDLDAERVSIEEALWGLFAFEAAIREAEVELVVRPGEAQESWKTCDGLAKLANDLLYQFPQYLDRPPKAMRKGRPEIPAKLADITMDRQAVLQAVRTTTRPLVQREDEYFEVVHLSLLMRDVAGSLIDKVPGELTSREYRELENHKVDISSRLIALRNLIGHLESKRETGLADAAAILAYLLRDHQETVARAYPRSVTVTDFLGSRTKRGPAKAAAARLQTEIAGGRLSGGGLDEEKVRELGGMVESIYQEAGDSVEPAQSNTWAEKSDVTDLVVNYSAGRLTVTGRAPAPLGVEGMGSHTTAWLVEVMALQWVVATTFDANEDPLPVIQGTVKEELRSKVLELDCLLPADQLCSGQLHAVFDAAVRTLEAEGIQSAAENYLRFRNLLPYATVDAGDRGGHGERRDAGKRRLFDEESLLQAAGQKADEYSPERLNSTIEALQSTAAALESNPGKGWATQKAVMEAVQLSIGRLKREAKALADPHPLPEHELVKKIMRVRRGEHNRVYRAARNYHDLKKAKPLDPMIQ